MGLGVKEKLTKTPPKNCPNGLKVIISGGGGANLGYANLTPYFDDYFNYYSFIYIFGPKSPTFPSLLSADPPTTPKCADTVLGHSLRQNEGLYLLLEYNIYIRPFSVPPVSILLNEIQKQKSEY